VKAAVFHAPKEPLRIEEVDTPSIGDDEILVRVAACGVCHTDLHYIDHGVPTFKKPPLILGHEASGVVEKIGGNVSGLEQGDRVLLPAVVTCGVCPFCRMGKENICQNMRMFGNHVDGAYAEYVVAPGKDAFVLPEEIPLEEGSIIADAISTPYHAVVNRAAVRAGDKVVVFGCGGVGINVVQMASAVGATVIAVDIAENKLEWAKKLGAAETINPTGIDVGKQVRKMTGGGADVALEVIGNPDTIVQAFGCVRSGGRVCIVGYTHKDVPLNAGRIMFREMEVVGSLGCRPVDYPKIIEMARVGAIKVAELVTHRFKLDDIGEAFEVLRKGEAIRSIVTP
jgi:6-hydroxycyclohex-1-ene-1-carbonyl-CoA dehydrogenase